MEKQNKDDYTLPAGGVDMDGYIKDALRTEGPLEPTITDGPALQGALEVLAAAGRFADEIRKLVIYKSAKVSEDSLVKAVDAIHAATDKFESALWRTVPEGYEGETIPVNRRLLHAALGSFGEQGEKLELLNEQITAGGKLNGPKYILESGDGKWFGALEDDELRVVTGYNVGMTCTANIGKLRVRLPGAFTTEAFLENRDYKAEEVAAIGKAA